MNQNTLYDLKKVKVLINYFVDAIPSLQGKYLNFSYDEDTDMIQLISYHDNQRPDEGDDMSIELVDNKFKVVVTGDVDEFYSLSGVLSHIEGWYS